MIGLGGGFFYKNINMTFVLVKIFNGMFQSLKLVFEVILFQYLGLWMGMGEQLTLDFGWIIFVW